MKNVTEGKQFLVHNWIKTQLSQILTVVVQYILSNVIILFHFILDVLFVTLMSDHVHLFEFAMNVTTVPTKDVVLYVVDQAYQMHIIAKSVLFKKKIEMVVQKLST